MKESWELPEGAEIAPGRSVVESLGGGRRYEVYLVWDDRLYALAVAKILRPDRVADGGAQKALRREAALLDRLAHPVIVRGFGSVLEGAHPHVLLEYLQGTDVRRLLRRQRTLELHHVVSLALDLLSALHYLGVERVVHLDIKPSNVILAEPPRLIDLGAARSWEEAAARRSPIGTAPYMSPEQCDPVRAGGLGPAADVWALGATLYEAVSGDVPFPRAEGARESPDPVVRYPQLAGGRPRPPRGVPPVLSEVLLAMLAYDAADRPLPAEASDALEPLAVEPAVEPR